MDAFFIARMERILWLYSQAYDKRFPTLCYDERPCFLIGEVVKGLEMKRGEVAKEHYAYEKNGSCNLLATIEPLTGKRIADVYQRRCKREFALHCQKVEKEFPKRKK